ncbi:hypothetical protein [Streptomyces katrae]|uniref:hypothetical protein n=1 Tax=Streptomyces katrae TaxID=68223 RepID=UPI0004C13D56|nr:hypothetical protein [Streptomyces katrae]
MSAPVEPRPAADLLQDALAAVDTQYQGVFGSPASWSPAVVGEYLIDCRLARLRATNWGEAA